MDTSDVIYDGFSFVDNGCVLTNIDHMRIAQRNNQIERLANRNGGVLVQSFFDVKTISIEGYYTGTDIEDAQAMYDTLAQALNRQERVLEIPHAGETRTYTATPDNLVIQQPGGLNRITFSFEFVVPKGSSTTDVDSALIASTAITTASTSIPILVEGSVKARPVFTLTFTSVTGGTGAEVNIRNARDFVGLSITRNWVSGDVMTVDCENFQIFINGTLTEPTGRFPSWEPGTGSVYYSDTFSSRNITIEATYNERNL